MGMIEHICWILGLFIIGSLASYFAGRLTGIVLYGDV